MQTLIQKNTGSIQLLVIIATLNTAIYRLITMLLQLLHTTTDNLALSNSAIRYVDTTTLPLIFNSTLSKNLKHKKICNNVLFDIPLFTESNGRRFLNIS